MRFLRRFLARSAELRHRAARRQRLREEMEEHLALQTEENLRAGMTPAEARRAGGAEVRRGGDSERGLPRGAGAAVL